MDVFSEMIWNRAIEAARRAKEELPADALRERYGAQYVIVALTESLEAADRQAAGIPADLVTVAGVM